MTPLPPGVGPRDAKIMIVGEAYGEAEQVALQPFVGLSGQELTRMLHDAGIARSECYITNCVNARPPGNDISAFFSDKKLTQPQPILQEGLNALQRDVAAIRPNILICLGNVPLWALTGHRGITSWRGSTLQALPPFHGVKVLPTYHPAAILRQWDWRFIAVHDLRRALGESAFPEVRTPAYNFLVRPSYSDAVAVVDDLLARCEKEVLPLAVDIETRAKHLACIGFAWTRLDAICLPLMCVERPEGYWESEQEFEIVRRVRRLLTHPNVRVLGQNFLYDLQYIARYWGIGPKVAFDTMLAQHCAWPGMPKGLDFISSMYCAFHQYWKDEGKLWDPTKVSEDRLWNYNCKDAVVTFESAEVLDGVLTQLNLKSQFEFQMEVFHTVFNVMLRGVRIDHNLRSKFVFDLHSLIQQRVQQAAYLSSRPLNPRSPKQLAEYFYDLLGLPEQRNRKTGKRTVSEDALVALAEKEPLARRLIYTIVESRQIGTSAAVAQAPLDVDRRIRCSYNVAGTVTFRFSSSEDAFGSGTNLQNVTSGKRSEETGLELPNLRRLFIPDAGRVVVDADLDRADLQVVVWEADDADLKAKLREGADVHTENAKDLFHTTNVTREQRQLAKVFVHATDYGGRARTVALHCGLPIHTTEIMQKRWFGAHPGILAWHRRVAHDLATKREVRNAFGNRIFFFNRVEGLLPEALAWIPQSTVALVINRGMVNLAKNCPQVELLLQVHDSLTFQIPHHNHVETLRTIRPHLLIPVPYPDPLTIPVGFKVSSQSWGDAKELDLSAGLIAE